MSEVATRAIDLSRAQTVMFGPISRRRSICQIVGRSPTLLFNSPRHSLTLISRDAEVELAHVKAQRIGNPSVAGKSSSYNINPRPCPRPSSSNTCLRPFTPNSRETRSMPAANCKFVVPSFTVFRRPACAGYFPPLTFPYTFHPIQPAPRVPDSSEARAESARCRHSVSV